MNCNRLCAEEDLAFTRRFQDEPPEGGLGQKLCATIDVQADKRALGSFRLGGPLKIY